MGMGVEERREMIEENKSGKMKNIVNGETETRN